MIGAIDGDCYRAALEQAYQQAQHQKFFRSSCMKYMHLWHKFGSRLVVYHFCVGLDNLALA